MRKHSIIGQPAEAEAVQRVADGAQRRSPVQLAAKTCAVDVADALPPAYSVGCLDKTLKKIGLVEPLAFSSRMLCQRRVYYHKTRHSHTVFRQGPKNPQDENQETAKMLRWSRANDWAKVFVLVAIIAALLTGCQKQTDVTAKKPPAKPAKIDLDSPSDATAKPDAPEPPPIAPAGESPPTPVDQPARPTTSGNDLVPPEPVARASGQGDSGSARPPARPIEAPTAAPITSRIGDSAAMPKVVLTAPMKAECVIGVGDRMPEGPLSDAVGKSVSLESIRGKTATVVFFFGPAKTKEGRALVVSALEDLAAEVASPWGTKGVAVAAVAVGVAAEEVQALRSKVNYPILNDSTGAYFSLVAKSQLPRVYLVDGTGHVAWFDIEFSRTTRRDLARALRAIAGNSR